MRRAARDGPMAAPLLTFVAALRRGLLGAAWCPGARSGWCRAQRQRLRTPGHFVVWVRRESMPWAKWGARHGYFELEWMDGLAYLRASRSR
jgi:hypothetical protein